MLSVAEKEQFLKRLRLLRLDSLQKAAIVKAIHERCKRVTECMHCGGLNGLIKKAGVLRVVHEKYRSTKRALMEAEEFRGRLAGALDVNPDIKTHLSKAQEDINPLDALRIFERISDSDCELLGIEAPHGRPERFLWTKIPVPPACIRPSIAMTVENGTNEDDLTTKLADIVYTNNIIRDALEKGVTVPMLMEDWDYLQLQCALYINSELPGVPLALQTSSKPIRGLCQRLKGKMGRFRGNLSGKRVDFSSRTVISPDPNLRIDQIGVPVYVAKTLTYPEQVTAFNLDRLRQAVINGPDQHPGANYLQSKDGLKRYLRFGDRRKIARDLRVGDTVERHLLDGDVVLFNRQPSLHKLSIMAHFAVVRPWRTFRFNECACTPYNADFDGDEMNLHLPQTEEARAEAVELMGLRHNMVTPRNGQPLIAAMQDFITASHLLTNKDVFYTKAEFTQICCQFCDALLHLDIPAPAVVHPKTLWTGKQVIQVLLKPNSKAAVNVTLGAKCRTFQRGSTTGLYGPEFCPVDGYLIVRNSEIIAGTLDKSNIGGDSKSSIFYVLMRDYSTEYAITCMTRLSKLCARWLGNRGFSIGIEDVQAGPSLRKMKRQVVAKGYAECDQNIADFRAGKLQNQPGCTADQTLEAMISGTLSRIRDDVGQACLQELPRDNAPLIMQWCGSKGSKINVSQMVACVGQQIISGSRIPDGFQQRSLPHFPKNSRAPAAKGFVENSFFSGLTPTEFFFHAISGREGLVDTAVKTAETGYMQRRLMKALEDVSTQYDITVRNSTGDIVQFIYGDDGLDPACMEGDGCPVNFDHNLLHARNTVEADSVVLDTPGMLTTLDQQAREDEIPVFFKDSLQAFVCRQGPIPSSQFESFLRICFDKHRKARIEPGTAVGALGAQSIGEPGTQMTLKTFHFAGVASMNVTLGVPRIKEIINAAKVISTPIITAPLACSSDVRSARIVKGRIEKALLGNITEHIEEVFEPHGCHIAIKLDPCAIQALQLDVDIYSVQRALIKAPRLRLQGSLIACPPDCIRVSISGASAEENYHRMRLLKRALPGIVVNGIPTVNRAVINDLGSSRYNLLVEGYGLRQVMVTDGVIGHECTSNHIMEVQSVLGIEAARSTIASEIQYTMSKHGMTIDMRHVTLLADVMTYRGEVLGITRFGIAKMKDSVLMLASFERTTDHLFDAARFCKQDSIDGVSECIIMGIPMPVGTGMMKVLQRVPPEQLGAQEPRKLLFDRPEFHPPLVSF